MREKEKIEDDWIFHRCFFNLQVNVKSYKTRPAAKDFIQVEIVVEKNSQKIILIGKVSRDMFLAKLAKLQSF